MISCQRICLCWFFTSFLSLYFSLSFSLFQTKKKRLQLISERNFSQALFSENCKKRNQVLYVKKKKKTFYLYPFAQKESHCPKSAV